MMDVQKLLELACEAEGYALSEVEPINLMPIFARLVRTAALEEDEQILKIALNKAYQLLDVIASDAVLPKARQVEVRKILPRRFKNSFEHPAVFKPASQADPSAP